LARVLDGEVGDAKVGTGDAVGLRLAHAAAAAVHRATPVDVQLRLVESIRSDLRARWASSIELG